MTEAPMEARHRDEEGEHRLTRYLIYSTDDGGKTLFLQGVLAARSSEEAYRHWFGDPTRANQEGVFVPISENAAKLRKRSVVTKPVVAVEEIAHAAIGQTSLPVEVES